MSFKQTKLALALAATIGLGGCFSGVDSITYPDVVLPPQPAPVIDVEVTGTVTDAVTGLAIDATLTFLNGGESTLEARLLDDDLTRVSELTATNGAFSFGFDNNTAINTVTILVEVDGYLAQTVTFDIANASATEALAFELFSETTAGLAVVEQTATVSAGVVASEVVIAAAATNGASTVTIPAGVVLQDADGNPISGSNITFQVVAIDSDETSADAVAIDEILPAGFQDATQASVFVPVAATTVNFFDENGNAIKNFSSPITIGMQIPSTRDVTAGDELVLKSYDEETGVWTTETNTVSVGTLMGSYYPATFQISHLTTFAAGKQVPTSDLCSIDTTVDFAGDAVTNGLTLSVARSVSGTKNVALTAGQTTAVITGTQSNTETATVTVKDTQNTVWGTASGVNACGTVDLTLVAPVYVQEELNITATCIEDETVFTEDENAVVQYVKTDSGNAAATAAYVSGGNYALTNLVEGSTYTVNINSGIAGVADYSVVITADGENESAPISYNCGAATGTGGTGGTGTGGTGGGGI